MAIFTLIVAVLCIFLPFLVCLSSDIVIFYMLCPNEFGQIILNVWKMDTWVEDINTFNELLHGISSAVTEVQTYSQ